MHGQSLVLFFLLTLVALRVSTLVITACTESNKEEFRRLCKTIYNRVPTVASTLNLRFDPVFAGVPSGPVTQLSRSLAANNGTDSSAQDRFGIQAAVESNHILHLTTSRAGCLPDEDDCRCNGSACPVASTFAGITLPAVVISTHRCFLDGDATQPTASIARNGAVGFVQSYMTELEKQNIPFSGIPDRTPTITDIESKLSGCMDIDLHNNVDPCTAYCAVPLGAAICTQRPGHFICLDRDCTCENMQQTNQQSIGLFTIMQQIDRSNNVGAMSTRPVQLDADTTFVWAQSSTDDIAVMFPYGYVVTP